MIRPSITSDTKKIGGAITGVIAFSTAISSLLVDIFNLDVQLTVGVTVAVVSIIITAVLLVAHVEKRQNETIDKHVCESEGTFVRIQKSLDDLSATVGSIRQDTLRIQLRTYIKDEPENIDTILTIANAYFHSNHGNWIATHEFLQWADDHHVHVPQNIHNAIDQIENNK